MAIAEACVLLAIGLLSGILSTVFDVLVVGGASYLDHFTLWVLLNALVAVHVESRIKAIWWAIPFNLGFVEGYFMTTVASFECYPKAYMVPLAAVALISPLLTYAIWTAKNERNAYGRILSVLIVACTLGASYAVTRSITTYDIVMCVLLALVLLVLPAKRLRISRSQRVAAEAIVDEELLEEEAMKPTPRATAGSVIDVELEPEERRVLKPTKRRRRKRFGRKERTESVVVEEPTPRRRSTTRRSSRRHEETPPQDTPTPTYNPTLGNVRAARRSRMD